MANGIRIDADWLSDPRLQHVLTVLNGDTDDARVVGGAVRNELLGLRVSDIDVASTALADVMVKRCERAGLRVIPTGLQHGTVTIVHDELSVEATTLREDVATDGRHADVAPTRDWAADAARRDFTINALYCDGEGRVLDPVGGLADIEARRVRFVGDPDTRIEEDYLRVLRYFRFHSQLGIEIENDEGFAACVRALPGFGRLSAERVASELLKLLATDAPQIGIRGLLCAGLLPTVLHAAPRVTRMEQVRDVLTLNEFTVETPEVLLLGALAVEVCEDAARLQERLRLSAADTKRLLNLSEPLDVDQTSEPRGVRAAVYRSGAKAFVDRLILARAGGSVGDTVWAMALDVAKNWMAPKFPLGGDDVMALGVEAGPNVGALLASSKEAWIESDFEMSVDQLRETLQALVLGRLPAKEN